MHYYYAIINYKCLQGIALQYSLIILFNLPIKMDFINRTMQYVKFEILKTLTTKHSLLY